MCLNVYWLSIFENKISWVFIRRFWPEKFKMEILNHNKLWLSKSILELLALNWVNSLLGQKELQRWLFRYLKIISWIQLARTWVKYEALFYSYEMSVRGSARCIDGISFFLFNQWRLKNLSFENVIHEAKTFVSMQKLELSWKIIHFEHIYKK